MPRLGGLAVICVVLASVVTVFFLSESVRKEIDALASANSDTTQWSLAQAEVDLLYLRLAAERASPDNASSLNDMRRRFDIFYSRVRTLTDSRQLQAVRNKSESTDPLQQITGFLTEYVPVIDGDDAGLVARLPDMQADLAQLKDPVRDFSLLGIRLFASSSDERRETVATLLSRIALLTLGLLITLGVVAIILFGLFRRSIRTERKAADVGARLQEVISTSIDAILVVDRAGRVLDYNGAAERIFGYTREETIGQDMAELIIPDHLKSAHNNGMAEYRETGHRKVVGSGLLRLEARRKDGTVFPVEVTISSAKSDDDEIFVSYLRDISQRVADETELIEARDKAVAGEKAKAELLAVMSHEMRTPLNGLMGTMELMQEGPLDARQMTFLQAMETSAKLLLHHVNGVLNISKADAGQLDLRMSEIDPVALLTETIESQRRSVEGYGNTISLSCTNAPARVLTDPLRLRQVLLNLVGNAAKFTRDGQIFVEIDRLSDGKHFEIRVADTGIGIEESNLERIFEDFLTLDASYGRSTEGTGLGLGIARRLVKAMGGDIGVESEPGEGSLFWVRLPIGELAPQQEVLPIQTPVTRPQTPERKMSVLLVEDNDINRLVARSMLSHFGHAVDEANDGHQGLAKADVKPYDVIFMDISMPVLDGIQATTAIRTGDGPNAQTPIIALTAHALPDDINRFTQAGINTTLTKPLTKAALAATLADVFKDTNPQKADGPVAQALSDLRDQLGDAQLRTLIARLLEEMEETNLLLHQHMSDAATFDQAAALAHKLAGSTSVFGLTSLANHLRKLETALRNTQGDKAQKLTQDLDQQLEQARQEIDRISIRQP